MRWRGRTSGPSPDEQGHEDRDSAGEQEPARSVRALVCLLLVFPGFSSADLLGGVQARSGDARADPLAGRSNRVAGAPAADADATAALAAVEPHAGRDLHGPSEPDAHWLSLSKALACCSKQKLTTAQS